MRFSALFFAAVSASLTRCLSNLKLAPHSQEIFGPVLTIVKADTLDDAIALINRNRYGNGSSVFTNSGATARRFEKEIQAGQVGINVGRYLLFALESGRILTNFGVVAGPHP